MPSSTDQPDDGWVSPQGASGSTGDDAPSSWGPAPELTPPVTPQPGAPQPGGAGVPPTGQPQYGQPQYGQPQFGPPQYGQPQGGQLQGGQLRNQPYGGYGQGAPSPFATAPRPGVVPLRPLSLGDLLDGAFRAIRFNPKVMFLVPIVLLAVSSALQAVLTYLMYERLGIASLFDYSSYAYGPLGELNGTPITGQDLVTGAVAALLTVVVSAIATLLITGILTFAVSDAVIGVKSTMAQIWPRLRPRLGALIGVSLLVSLIMTLLIVIVLAGPIAVTSQDNVGFTVLAWLLAIPVLGVLLAIAAIRFVFTTQVVALEGVGPVAALSRAWRLVAGSFWRVLGILLLTSLLLGIIAGIITFPIQLVASFAMIGGATNTMWVTVATATVASLVQTALTVPFYASITTLLYVDVRMRREGLDVQLSKAAAA